MARNLFSIKYQDAIESASVIGKARRNISDTDAWGHRAAMLCWMGKA